MWIKKILCLSLLLCCLLVSVPGTCSAAEQEEMKPISSSELTELMEISNQLSSTTTQQLQNYLELKKQLDISKQLIVSSQKQIVDYQNLTTDLTNSLNKALQENKETKNSLTELNKSFSEYQREVRSTIDKEKAAHRRDNLIRNVIIGALLYDKFKS